MKQRQQTSDRWPAAHIVRRWGIRLFVVAFSAAFSWLLAQVLDPDFASTAALIGVLCSSVVALLVDRLVGRFRAIIRDQNARLEHQVRELEQVNELMAQRNTELRAFAQTVAHDLKSPLTQIMVSSEFLANELSSGRRSELIEIAQGIVESSANMKQIIEDLLLLASVRQADVQPRPLVMGRIVRKALHRLESPLLSCEARVEVAADLPLAFGYEPWLEQVWVNLISNACKYGCDPAGRLHLELGGEERGEVARFWLRDHGVGVDPDQADQLFREFTRLQPQCSSGHGLGLWIVKRIVTRLGGDVGVEAELDEGVRFFFELPRDSQRLSSAPDQSGPWRASARRQESTEPRRRSA